ncbi:MAG: tyrosine-type recombinase/integrase [Pseudomonadota bacterium]
MPDNRQVNRQVATDSSAAVSQLVAVGERNLLDLYLLRFDRPHTRRSYRNDLIQFFNAETLTLDLVSQVSFVDVNEHIRHCETRGLKPTTIRRRVASLRGFFAWLIALGAIPTNPADRHLVRTVRGGRYSDAALTVLTREQASRLVRSVDLDKRSGVRDRAILLTLLHCVLRRSEAAAMRCEHVRPVGPYWVLDLPLAKGGADQFVKLPAFLVEEYDTVKSAYGISQGPLWISLSNNSYGSPLSDRSIFTIVKKYAKRAGITEDVGAHTLRHTGCTLAIENGASLQQVQAHARHKRIETTMVYIHQRDRLRDSAGDYIRLDD